MNPEEFALTSTPSGIDLVVTGAWSSRARDAILGGRADGLVLNYARGFQEPDLSFMEGLPLKRLEILARGQSDLEPIYSLAATLQELNVQTAPTVLDLSRLPHLTNLGAIWSQIADTISVLVNLQRLFTLSYGDRDLTPLAANQKLVSVRMKDRPRVRSLVGIEALPRLERLQLPLAPLSDLRPLVSAAPSLRDLDLEACRRIHDISPIASLPNLTSVNFSDCGDIESVQVFEDLKKVEDIQMWGTTRVLDSDLSSIANLPALRVLRMNSRRDYRPPVADIKARIGDF